MKKQNWLEYLTWVLAVIPLIVTVAVYSKLPEQIPTHWNIAGEIDSYSAKSFAFMMPTITLLLTVLLKFSPKFDPKRDNYKKFKGAYTELRLLLVLFFNIMTGVTLYAAFDAKGLPINAIIMASVGLLLCFIGSLMPKFKHNYFVGIRVPWTLASEPVWDKTHKMASPIWIVGGIAIALSAFFSYGVLQIVILLTVVIACVVVPAVYSYLLYKNINPNK